MKASTAISNFKKRFGVFILIVSMLLTMAACSNGEITNYVNQNGHTYTTSSVTTPKNVTVTTWKYNELTTQEIADANSYVSTNYPNATKLREPTLKYNCHSYAWYSTSTSNTHWMNDPSAYYTGTNKSYTLITTGSTNTIPSSVSNGSKVTYTGSSLEHSAIKTSSTKFTSKWGAAGLYEHTPTYAPYTASFSYYKAV